MRSSNMTFQCLHALACPRDARAADRPSSATRSLTPPRGADGRVRAQSGCGMTSRPDASIEPQSKSLDPEPAARWAGFPTWDRLLLVVDRRDELARGSEVGPGDDHVRLNAADVH